MQAENDGSPRRSDEGRVRIESRRKRTSDIPTRAGVNAEVTRPESRSDDEDAGTSADAARGSPGPALGPVQPSRGVHQRGDEPLEAHEQRSRHRGVRGGLEDRKEGRSKCGDVGRG